MSQVQPGDANSGQGCLGPGECVSNQGRFGGRAPPKRLVPKVIRVPGVMDAATVSPANARTRPRCRDDTNQANKPDVTLDANWIDHRGLTDFLASPQLA